MESRLIKVLLLMLYVAALPLSCSKEPAGENEGTVTYSFTESEKDFVKGNYSLTSDLLDMFYKREGTAYDFLVSPLNTQILLGMLNAGASADLSAKICDILGYQDRNTENINTFCRKAIEESGQIDRRAVLDLENHWALNNLTGYTINSSLSSLLKDYYHVNVESSDFIESESGLDCVVSSTMGFSEEWSMGYKRVVQAFFYRAINERMSDVEFLSDLFPEVDLFYNDVFASVYLPFGDGVYEMVICASHGFENQPTTVASVIDYLKHNPIPEPTEKRPVSIRLPLMSVQSSYDLGPILNDYYGVDLVPAGKKVNHQASLSIDKKVLKYQFPDLSDVLMENLVIFHANHPFVYLIREKKSGLVLLAGMFAGGQI